MKVQDYSQMIRHMTRDKTTDVPGSMAHGLKTASAETDAVKDMINKQYGSGTMKYGSEIPQPSQRPDVIEIDAINSFMKRNPAAEGGQMVKPSADGSRPGYAGARYDDPRSNIKVGDELGKGIRQQKINKYTRTGFPKYISSAGNKSIGLGNVTTTNSLEEAKEARKTLIEKVGGLKKRERLEASFEVLSEDPLFEKFFKKQIETNSNIKKAMKANNLTKSNSLEEIFNALSDETAKSANLTRAGKKNPSGVSPSAVGNLQRTFNKVFKTKQKNIGKLTTSDLIKKLGDVGIKTTSNQIRRLVRYGEPNYEPIKYPVGTKDYIGEQTRIRAGKSFMNTLKDLGINIERAKADPNRPSRAKPGFTQRTPIRLMFDMSESQFKNLAQSNFFQKGSTYKKLLDEFTSQSKQSDEYKLNKYRKDSENIDLLKRNLNRTVDSLSDTELKNWIKQNPKLKNLVTAYFDATSGEIKNFKTLDEVPNLRDKTKFERDHIRGRSTVKYDPATKKIMDGIGIEYPKNLYIIPRGVNNATKRTVENYVALNPNEKTKIKKINKWFKDNDLTYYDRNNNKYSGATPKITNTDLSHLGLTNEQVLLNDRVNPKTGELVIEKGSRLLERIQERNKQLQILVSKGGAKGKAAARALQIIAAGGLGYSMEDILKGTGLMDKEYELTASAGDAPLVEKGLSTGEKVAAGTAAGLGIGTKTGRKILGNTLSAAGLPLSVALNTAIGIDPTSAVDRTILAGEAALAPSMIKDAIRVTDKIKNPLLRKGIETLAGVRIPGVMNPANALKIARVASPLGIATLGGEALYNYGKFAKNEIDRVRAMPEDERRAYNESLMDEGSMFEYE
jgi:hypothetical protein